MSGANARLTSSSASQAGLAAGEGRIVEEGKAHRALDLECAVAGQEHRGRVGIDALDRRSAMGRRFGQQGENRFLLPGFAFIHS